jgi:hypothetical protein
MPPSYLDATHFLSFLATVAFAFMRVVLFFDNLINILI